MTNQHKVFCENIKRLRTLKGISQGELAEMMQIRQTTLSRIENGKTEPGIGTMEKVAEALKISLIELLLDGNDENNSIQEKLLKIQSLNQYDQKLLEALFDSFIEKQNLKEQLQVKMNKRLDELKKVRNQ